MDPCAGTVFTDVDLLHVLGCVDDAFGQETAQDQFGEKLRDAHQFHGELAVDVDIQQMFLQDGLGLLLVCAIPADVLVGCGLQECQVFILFVDIHICFSDVFMGQSDYT